MTEPAIHCAHTSVVPVETLRPNPRNPNRHPEDQIWLLSRIIAQQGWRAPITVSTRISGLVVRGHARLMAAKLLGCTVCPVDEQDYPDEASETADMIADNRIAELAEMDMAALKDALQDLDTGAFDMELTGFELPVLEELLTRFFVDEDDGNQDAGAGQGNGGTDGPQPKSSVTCPQCGHEFVVPGASTNT